MLITSLTLAINYISVDIYVGLNITLFYFVLTTASDHTKEISEIRLLNYNIVVVLTSYLRV